MGASYSLYRYPDKYADIPQETAQAGKRWTMYFATAQRVSHVFPKARADLRLSEITIASAH